MTKQVNRDRISILYQSGISNAMEVTRRTGIPKSMVYRTISKLNAKISIMRERRSRKGRVIVKNDTISLVKLARNNRHMSIRKLTSKFNTTRSNTYSRETVRQHLKRLGHTRKVAKPIPFLTQRHMDRRVSWAKENKATGWEKVVYSDEMSIWLSRGKVCLWCKRDEHPVKPTSKHTPKLHVWGAFSARSTFPLKIFWENLTGLGYIHISNECLIAQGQVLYPDGWIFQDNDPKHTSKIAKDFMQKEGIARMDWPACSPDLNPIENLWAWIKMQVNLRSPKTLGELEKVVNQVWESISIEFLRPYWESMKKRLVW